MSESKNSMNFNFLDIENLRSKKVVKHDMTFEFLKIPVIDAFKIFDRIRKELIDSSKDNLQKDLGVLNENKIITNIFLSIFSVSPQFINYLKNELFKYIKFKRSTDNVFFVMADMSSMIENELDVIDFYELIVRSLAVNFFLSIQKLISLLPKPHMPLKTQ